MSNIPEGDPPSGQEMFFGVQNGRWRKFRLSVLALIGPKGDKGSKGDAGLKGDTGSQGLQGLPGKDGKDGAQGLKGDTGAQGIQGTKGDTGAAGKDGTNGTQGIQGTAGAKGDKGDAGLQGIQGLTGSQGPKGDTGSQGLKGDTGGLILPKRFSGVTNASGVATIAFSPSFTSVPDIDVIEAWSGSQMISGAVLTSSVSGCTVQVMTSRATLLLSAGPFQAAGAGVNITVRAIGN